MNAEVKIMASFGALSFAIFVWAFVDMLLGSSTAINGVIAFGFCAAVSVPCAASLRDDKPRLVAVPKPDYAKIAALEIELGITEAPPQGVLRRVERDGETTEYRTWGDFLVDISTYEQALADFDEGRKP
jgi:hypothetical protein